MKQKKTKRVMFRCTEKELNRMRLLARLYAEGDLSRWLRHAGINADRKMVKKCSEK